MKNVLSKQGRRTARLSPAEMAGTATRAGKANLLLFRPTKGRIAKSGYENSEWIEKATKNTSTQPPTSRGSLRTRPKTIVRTRCSYTQLRCTPHYRVGAWLSAIG